MRIYPAIDLFDGKAVRLYKGRYEDMTIYNEHPEKVALDFAASGAEYIHLVDLQGAKEGTSPNFETVRTIVSESGLPAEIGGGIRSMKVAQQYFSAGVTRIILGTAAVEDEAFLKEALKEWGSAVAIGADIKDGYVAVRGWLEKSQWTARDFMLHMQDLGVATIICTDISRDGAMKGSNNEMYRELNGSLSLDLVASGGVSSMDDLLTLKSMGMHGAIIGKAYYTGAIDLKKAIEAVK